MYIKELQVENFGPHKTQMFRFKENGINILYGPNDSGKTQILSAIYAAIFDKKILNYYSNSELIGKTMITICSENKDFTINQVHTNEHSYLAIDNFEEINSLHKLKRNNIYFYFPEFERHKRTKYSKEDIKKAFEFLQKIGIKNHHILGNCNAKTEMNVLMSIGEERYLNLICFIMNIPQGSVVIGDGLLAFYDSEWCKAVIDILVKTQGIQFIIAENEHTFNVIKEKNIFAHRLYQNSAQLSPVSYNYKEIPRNQLKSIENTDLITDAQTVIPISYRIGDEFYCGESKEVELKEIKGKNPCDSIIDTAEIYINAYLNSKMKNVGKIFWGIDDKKTICGVRLTYDNIDTIQKRISEATSHAHPMIDPELYTIEFHKAMTEEGTLAEDIYVVEIDVYPHEPKYLYSTSKNEVYVKTAGGKQKLDSFDLQTLFENRLKTKK